MTHDLLFDDELQAAAYDLSNLIDMTENAQERAQYRDALRSIENRLNQHGN
mgnify:CR=1 FL=1